MWFGFIDMRWIQEVAQYSIHRTLVNTTYTTTDAGMFCELIEEFGSSAMCWWVAKNFAHTYHITCLINEDLLPPALLI